jgi:lipid-binding SYLF domain-containing protein
MRLAAITLLALIVPVTPSLAQAAGHVRVKIVKAGLLVGGGAGSGVLTYRGSHAR